MLTRLMITLMSIVVVCGPIWGASVAYTRVRDGKVAAHVVTVNLADPEVRVSVALARGGAGRQESFKSMIGRVRPVAAITGTFFDTRTLIPTGDIGLFGTIVHSGCIGSALCIDTNNRASIVTLRKGRTCDWEGYETVLCAGPTLISNGKMAISLKSEGFRPSLYAPARRTAVGINHSGKLLIVAINRGTSLHATARLMLKLGVRDALCLDGGSSTAFYSAGRFLAIPSRRLTNCLVIYSSSQQYYAAKPVLAPAELFAKAEVQDHPQPMRQPMPMPAALLSSVPVALGGPLYPTIGPSR